MVCFDRAGITSEIQMTRGATIEARKRRRTRWTNGQGLGEEVMERVNKTRVYHAARGDRSTREPR